MVGAHRLPSFEQGQESTGTGLHAPRAQMETEPFRDNCRRGTRNEAVHRRERASDRSPSRRRPARPPASLGRRPPSAAATTVC